MVVEIEPIIFNIPQSTRLIHLSLCSSINLFITLQKDKIYIFQQVDNQPPRKVQTGIYACDIFTLYYFILSRSCLQAIPNANQGPQTLLVELGVMIIFLYDSSLSLSQAGVSCVFITLHLGHLSLFDPGPSST